MIGQIIYAKPVRGHWNVYLLERRYASTYVTDKHVFPRDIAKVLRERTPFFRDRQWPPDVFAHISLNLPHGEHLGRCDFYKISEEYMDNMGYGEQPYEWSGTAIPSTSMSIFVTTNVKGDGKKVLGISTASKEIARHSAPRKKVGLSPFSKHQTRKATPVYTDCPELQFGMDAEKGTKYYLQDVLNGSTKNTKCVNSMN